MFARRAKKTALYDRDGALSDLAVRTKIDCFFSLRDLRKDAFSILELARVCVCVV